MEDTPESDGVMDGENADFHTVSEFTEGIVERDENNTDHVVQNNGQELQGEVAKWHVRVIR
jgi:hypothetical protein